MRAVHGDRIVEPAEQADRALAVSLATEVFQRGQKVASGSPPEQAPRVNCGAEGFLDFLPALAVSSANAALSTEEAPASPGTSLCVSPSGPHRRTTRGKRCHGRASL